MTGTTDASPISPFTIDIPQATLDDLTARLERTLFAQTIPGTGWQLGTDADALADLATYWRDGYDWRVWEARLNAYPQFVTEIDGQRVHFLHIRSAVESATPLILLHGWPGSVVEFLDVIGPLTDPVAHGGQETDAFHLVIPSHPGFGFSGPTHELGWSAGKMARTYAALMANLGYEHYGAQGGDFGAFIAPELGRHDPDHVIGVHVNAATAGFIPWGEASEEEKATFSASELVRLERLGAWNAEGSAYFQIMATKPQSLSFGLADSPVGQLAWILEKFHDWTDNPDGTLAGTIDRDHVLTNVMIYWLTNTAATSAQLYWESMHTYDWPQGVVAAPLGVANFAQDVAIRRYGEQGYTVVHWSEFDRGGHFAAMEAPDLLVGDVRTFFAGLRD